MAEYSPNVEPLPSQGDQAPVERDGIEPPFKDDKDELTIIWRREKLLLHQRLDAQEKVIEQLNQRIMTLEAWAIQLRREPTVFTMSEHPLYRRDQPDRSAWDAPKPTKPTPGAGIGQAIPSRGKDGIPEVDYEGPREGPHGNTGPS